VPAVVCVRGRAPCECGAPPLMRRGVHSPPRSLGNNEDKFYTDWEESFDAFDQMGLHENLLRGIYGYGAWGGEEARRSGYCSARCQPPSGAARPAQQRTQRVALFSVGFGGQGRASSAARCTVSRHAGGLEPASHSRCSACSQSHMTVSSRCLAAAGVGCGAEEGAGSESSAAPFAPRFVTFCGPAQHCSIMQHALCMVNMGFGALRKARPSCCMRSSF
jgi:hypothetical protein